MSDKKLPQTESYRDKQVRLMAAGIATLRNATYEKDMQKQRRKNLGLPYKGGRPY